MIKVEDFSSEITCIELNKRGNIVLLGTSIGLVYIYAINKSFQSGFENNKNDQELIEENELE